MPAPNRPTKSLRFEVKDAEKGIIEAVFSTFGVKDLDGDVTLPDAFEEGAAVAISAYGHGSWMGAKPIGRGTIHVEKTRATMAGQLFLDTTDGLETFRVIKGMGELQEYSYGYDVLKTGEITEEMRQSGVRRVLAKLKVFEVSPVLLGAGIGTQTLGAKAAEEEAAALREMEESKAAILRELAHFERTRARHLGAPV